jgi:hypothetical protein
MCDGGEVISFSEGNEQQEALVLLPAFGWIDAEGELFHLIPQERCPWRGELKCASNGGCQ